MVDETYIRLIDTHAECIRGDHHVGITGHEPLLNFGSFRRIQSAVIEESLATFFFQRVHDGLGILARRHVNDPGLFGPVDTMNQRLQFLRFLLKAVYPETICWAGQTRHEHFRRLHPKPLHNLFAHLRRSRRRHRKHSGMAQPFDCWTELHVIGTKVVAPFADAVGLVDHEQRNARVLKRFDGFLFRSCSGARKMYLPSPPSIFSRTSRASRTRCVELIRTASSPIEST